MKASVFNREGQLVETDTPRVVLSDAEWQARLTPEQYRVARGKGTEAPFCGTLLDNQLDGVYLCVCCGLPLFLSDAKFHSGTGWPSFFQPDGSENVHTEGDRSYGMVREEILCTRCYPHLGISSPECPPAARQRYCVNSDSLVFTEKSAFASLAEV